MTTPAKLQAGDTLEWQYSGSQYPAPTWTLTQTFVSPGGGPTIPEQTAAAGANGEHLIKVSAVDSDFPEGVHQFAVKVTDGTSVYTIDNGTTQVLADLTQVTGDRRSHAVKMLEAIQAAMLGNATHEQIAFAFEDVSFSHITPEQVQDRYDYWRRQVAAEERTIAAKQGRPNRSVVRHRMWS